MGGLELSFLGHASVGGHQQVRLAGACGGGAEESVLRAHSHHGAVLGTQESGGGPGPWLLLLLLVVMRLWLGMQLGRSLGLGGGNNGIVFLLLGRHDSSSRGPGVRIGASGDHGEEAGIDKLWKMENDGRVTNGGRGEIGKDEIYR